MKYCFENFPLCLTYSKDIVTIICLVIAAWVAIVGLQTWKQQLHGTQAYDLAKRVLQAIYLLRDAVKQVRFPYSPVEARSALNEVKIEAAYYDDDYEIKSYDAVTQVRWKKVVDALKNLEVEAVEAETLWGKEARKSILAIEKSVFSLREIISLYKREMYLPDESTTIHDHLEDTRKILFCIPDDEDHDSYVLELNRHIYSVEKLVRPYLSK